MAQPFNVFDRPSWDQAKKLVKANDVRGFRDRGADKDGNLLLACLNGKGDLVIMFHFTKPPVRKRFASFLMDHLHVTIRPQRKAKP